MSAKKILIVDDEPDIVDLFAECLGSKYVIFRATNGVDALEIVKSKNPDVILSDINMPNLDGLQMLERLRAEGLKIPVILVTGYSDTKRVYQAWKLGAFDFLDKPVNLEHLQSVVNKALEFGLSFMDKPVFSKDSGKLTLTDELAARVRSAAKSAGMTPEKWIEAQLLRSASTKQ